MIYKNREPKTGNQKQGTKNREPKTGNQKQGNKNREPKTGNQKSRLNKLLAVFPTVGTEREQSCTIVFII